MGGQFAANLSSHLRAQPLTCGTLEGTITHTLHPVCLPCLLVVAPASTHLLHTGSGLMLLGLDASRVGSYFVPSLGPAPRWASFLEGLTEELEESSPTLYDDYRCGLWAAGCGVNLGCKHAQE